MLEEPAAREFTARLSIGKVQRLLWVMLSVFVVLSLSDVMITLAAAMSGRGFVEFNPIGAGLFKMGFTGFMLAYVLKLVPVLPLLYMVSLRDDGFQARLLKLAAFVVLLVVDAYLGAIVLGNNLPQLLGLSVP